MSDTVDIKTWNEQGYDPYLTNYLAPSDPGYITNSDFNSQVQDASITTIKVKSIAADVIRTGILYSTDQKTYFDLDGKRIIINDGTNDRVLLGFLSGGF